MKGLLVIANLSRIRAVKFHKEGTDPIDKEHLVEDPALASDDHRLDRGEVVTGKSGRFARGAPAGEGGGMSYGEEHHLEAELERQALQNTAQKIAALLAEEKPKSWTLVAPQPILRRLEEALPSTWRTTLAETIGADLTREPIKKLERRFGVRR